MIRRSRIQSRRSPPTIPFPSPMLHPCPTQRAALSPPHWTLHERKWTRGCDARPPLPPGPLLRLEAAHGRPAGLPRGCRLLLRERCPGHERRRGPPCSRRRHGSRHRGSACAVWVQRTHIPHRWWQPLHKRHAQLRHAARAHRHPHTQEEERNQSSSHPRFYKPLSSASPPLPSGDVHACVRLLTAPR
jgi:hypothetical protein